MSVFDDNVKHAQQELEDYNKFKKGLDELYGPGVKIDIDENGSIFVDVSACTAKPSDIDSIPGLDPSKTKSILVSSRYTEGTIDPGYVEPIKVDANAGTPVVHIHAPYIPVQFTPTIVNGFKEGTFHGHDVFVITNR
jgi:hypothetical protein